MFTYISNVADSILPLLQERKLHSLHFVVSTHDRDLERVTINLLALDAVKTQTQLDALRLSLKCCLLKLSVIETYLPRRLSDDLTWRVEIGAEDKEMDLNQTDWIKTELDSNGTEFCLPNIIPLKTVTTDCMKVEVFVEKMY